MKNRIDISPTVSGKLDWLKVMRQGEVIASADEVRNLVLNSGIGSGNLHALAGSLTCNLTDTVLVNYDDPSGTFSQIGATVTRMTGTFSFTSSDVGREFKFATGERFHVVTFISTTTVTVSNSRTVAATTLRRYFTTSDSFSLKQATTMVNVSAANDLSTGICSRTVGVTMTPATTAYTLRTIDISGFHRIVLPTPISVAVDDQIQLQFSAQVTFGSKELTFNSNSMGLPIQYPIASITGNGTYFDIVVGMPNGSGASAHHFLTGDTIRVPSTIVPLRKTITSITSNSTTWTATAIEHGFNVGDSIVHEGVNLSDYNGSWTVATVPDTNTYTVTNASNPGSAIGGTTRQAKPGTYFDGDWVVASVPNSTTIRITSIISGPSVDPSSSMGSVPGAKLNIWAGQSGPILVPGFSSSKYFFNETNAKAIPPITQTTDLAISGGVSSSNFTSGDISGSFANDFASSSGGAWNAGIAEQRVKQFYWPITTGQGLTGIPFRFLVTLDNAQPKFSSWKWQMAVSMKVLRDLP